jgi:hypothetical protein
VLAAQVNFIVRAVEGEADRAFGCAAIDVVNEQSVDFLRLTCSEPGDVDATVVWLERQRAEGGPDLSLGRARPTPDDGGRGTGCRVSAVDYA